MPSRPTPPYSTPRADLVSAGLWLLGDSEEPLTPRLEEWDYATELDLPRRNGQVFLPEDDGSWWGVVEDGSDEANAIEQIRILRRLADRIDAQVGNT